LFIGEIRRNKQEEGTNKKEEQTRRRNKQEGGTNKKEEQTRRRNKQGEGTNKKEEQTRRRNLIGPEQAREGRAIDAHALAGHVPLLTVMPQMTNRVT
jgi:hypothetical protein